MEAVTGDRKFDLLVQIMMMNRALWQCQ